MRLLSKKQNKSPWLIVEMKPIAPCVWLNYFTIDSNLILVSIRAKKSSTQRHHSGSLFYGALKHRIFQFSIKHIGQRRHPEITKWQPCQSVGKVVCQQAQKWNKPNILQHDRQNQSKRSLETNVNLDLFISYLRLGMSVHFYSPWLFLCWQMENWQHHSGKRYLGSYSD